MSRGVAKTKGHKKALLKAAELICGICLRPIDVPETATVDHIVPLAVGGSNHRDNVQLAHAKCNRRKGDNPDYVPLHLRKTRCPNCGRSFKNLAMHIEVKHKLEVSA